MTDTASEPSDGVAFAIGLLNTWDELEPDPECLRDVGFVQRFLARHGLEDAARVARDDDLEPLRRLRESLARAWDAANEETAVAELNTLLAGAKAQPWLERREGGSRFRYDRPGMPVREFAHALAARALLEEIAAGRLEPVRPLRRRPLPLRLHRPDPERRAQVLLPTLRRPCGAPGVPAPPGPPLTSVPSYRQSTLRYDTLDERSTMRLLAAALAAAAVLAPAALADPPDTRTHTDVNSTRTITVCGFPVVLHSEGVFTTWNYFDESGNLVRQRLHVERAFTVTWSNPANGKSISSVSVARWSTSSLPTPRKPDRGRAVSGSSSLAAKARLRSRSAGSSSSSPRTGPRRSRSSRASGISHHPGALRVPRLTNPARRSRSAWSSRSAG